jgi:predicted glycosyltransferase involved in capsule biosynthesis
VSTILLVFAANFCWFSADYFGGITSFSEIQFGKINGFPNNFWGWGGEDDELKLRTKEVNLYVEQNLLLKVDCQHHNTYLL